MQKTSAGWLLKSESPRLDQGARGRRGAPGTEAGRSLCRALPCCLREGLGQQAQGGEPGDTDPILWPRHGAGDSQLAVSLRGKRHSPLWVPTAGGRGGSRHAHLRSSCPPSSRRVLGLGSSCASLGCHGSTPILLLSQPPSHPFHLQPPTQGHSSSPLQHCGGRPSSHTGGLPARRRSPISWGEKGGPGTPGAPASCPVLCHGPIPREPRLHPGL